MKLTLIKLTKSQQARLQKGHYVYTENKRYYIEIKKKGTKK